VLCTLCFALRACALIRDKAQSAKHKVQSTKSQDVTTTFGVAAEEFAGADSAGT
jgi:hypothetical protein